MTDIIARVDAHEPIEKLLNDACQEILTLREKLRDAEAYPAPAKLEVSYQQIESLYEALGMQDYIELGHEQEDAEIFNEWLAGLQNG